MVPNAKSTEIFIHGVKCFKTVELRWNKSTKFSFLMNCYSTDSQDLRIHINHRSCKKKKTLQKSVPMSLFQINFSLL